MTISRKKTTGATRKSNKRKVEPVVAMIDWRPNAVLIGIGITFLMLIGRAFHLQVIKADDLAAYGNRYQIRSVTIAAHRGSIVDRHGKPLAVSTPVDSIWVNPQEVAGSMDRIGELAAALDRDKAALLSRISRHLNKKFIYLQRAMPPERAEAVIDLGIEGVYKQREYRRFYTAPEETGHILGFTDIDDLGLEAIELAFDSWLRGEPGVKNMRRDLHGRLIEDVELVKAAKPGKELALSIDLDIQYLAYRELKRVITANGARSGSIVVLDVDTGEILAMVNQPSYNPNDRSQFAASRYRNRAATDITEPGSAMKPFIVAAALESGLFTPESVVNTSPGWYTVGQKKIEDRTDNKTLTLGGILKVSSNVGISKVALGLPPEQLWRTLTNLGFGRLTTSGFPGESAGLLTSYQRWPELVQATIAYGYGLSVTPLQLAQAYATIGNGGEHHPITFLKRDKAVSGERVLNERTCDDLLKMLETVTELDGTGKQARIAGFRVSGKTGTARKYEAGGYSDLRHVAMFAGLAPASDPELAVVVVVDEPGGDEYYGGQVAAPVFAKVMGGALRVRAVAPDSPASMSASEAVGKALAPSYDGDDS